MMETTELDTTQEQVSTNGHDVTFATFDDDMAFLQHILGTKPAEKLVETPEWNVRILCRALNAEDRMKVQIAAYEEESKKVDYRRVFPQIVMGGCYNPTTEHKVFREKHLAALTREQDGAPIERLAIAILQLSGMLSSETERARKN